MSLEKTERNTELRNLRLEGWTFKALSERYDISIRQVRRLYAKQCRIIDLLT